MARSGMGDLITRARRMVNDSAGSVWTNDTDIQDVLDEHKIRVQREQLEMEKTYTSGTAYVYQTFHSRYGNLEGGGSATFQLEDSAGTQRGTADYTADYIRGVITMTADQAGTKLYLTGWSYDLDAAAADLWRERAGQVASYYNVTTDGHNLSRAQWYEHCMKMADDYESKARAVVVRSWTHGVFDNE